MKYLFVLLSSILLISCQSSPTKEIAKPKTPNWYLNPPADTNKTLYGVGEGKTQNKAIQSALAYLGAKLSVSISSKTSIQKNLYQGVYEFNEVSLKKQTTTEVKQITINQFRQLEMKQIGYEKFITLIKSDKDKLVDDFKQQLNQQIQKFQRDATMHNSKAGYTKFQQAQQHFKTLDSFDNKLAVYQSLSPSSSIQKYQQHVKRVAAYFKQQQKTTIFKVTSNKTATKNTLQDYLNKLGFTTSSNNFTNQIKLNNQIKVTSAEGFSIIRNQLNISYFEKYTKQYGNTFHIKGQGLNLQQSTANEQKRLKIILEQNGLNYFLGIHK